MQTYCKNVKIDSLDLIKQAINNFVKNNRTDAAYRYLARYVDKTKRQVKTSFLLPEQTLYKEAVSAAALRIQEKIQTRTLEVAPIKYSERWDINRAKMRTIGKQEVESCILDHMIVLSMQDFFGRIGQYQVASMPKRGQLYGAKKIAEWIKDPEIEYFVQADIIKCYKHITPEIIYAFVSKYVKNEGILYVLRCLLSQHIHGLSIGSYISQWLCNSYLAEAYHLVERMHFKRRDKNLRMVDHMLFYMDDILLIGRNKKQLTKAAEILEEFLSEKLHLYIKPWQCRSLNETYHGKKAFIDMMGYKIHRGYLTIRARIYRKIRRKMLRLSRQIAKYNSVSLKLAISFTSYYGYIKHSAQYKIFKKYGLARIMEYCRRKISLCSK